MGWFGPRGLASIVFAVIVVEESQLPHQQTILLAIYLTVGLSILCTGSPRRRWPTATGAGMRPTPGRPGPRWRERPRR